MQHKYDKYKPMRAYSYSYPLSCLPPEIRPGSGRRPTPPGRDKIRFESRKGPPGAQGSALRTRKGMIPLTPILGSAQTRPRRAAGKERNSFPLQKGIPCHCVKGAIYSSRPAGVSINRIPLRGQTLDFVPAPFSKKNALHYA